MVTDEFRPESDNVQNLFQKADQLFQIPSYQRRYSWGEEDWEYFWDDLNSLSEDEIHFLSTIVVIPNEFSIREPTVLEVVDGQQRLATLSVIICALRDYYSGEGEMEKADYLDEQYLFVRSSSSNDSELKLQLGNLDAESYENLVKGRLDYIDDGDQLGKAYDFFSDRISEAGGLNEVEDLQTRLEWNAHATIIHAGNPADAHRLFETLNNRGVELTPVDLIKNHVFRISDRRNEDLDTIKDIWTDIIRNLEGLGEVRFFRQYLMSTKLLSEENDEITDVRINKKVSSSKLYGIFREIVEDTSDIEGLLRDIKSQSELYWELRNQKTDKFDRNVNLEINNRLEDLETISKTTFTLFLRAFRETDDSDLLMDLMENVIALMVRRSITGLSTAPHDTIFNHLAQNAFRDDSPSQYVRGYLQDENFFPDDESFRESFAADNFREEDFTRYLLAKIEEVEFGHGGKKVTDNRYELHIEHILPRRYSKSLQRNWLDPHNISRREHRSHRHRIGNLTLLESGPNISASQRTLERKQQYYENETDIKMTQKLVKEKRWGVDEINARSERMAGYAVDIWSLN